MSTSLPRRTTATAWTQLTTRRTATPAVVALAIYTFLLLSRLPELLSFIGMFRPILVVGVVMIALAASLPASRMQWVQAAPESRAMLLLFVFAALSVPLSVWPGLSFRWVLFSFSKTTIFFLLLLYCVRGFKEFRYLVWAFLGAHGALELGVVFLNVRERARVTGTYDPNDLAFAIVCALPVAVMLLVVERGWRRWAIVPFLPLGLIAIIHTRSRGGLVSLIVIAAIVLAKLPIRNPLLPAGLTIAGILVFSLFAPQSYWDRMATIGWGGEEPPTEQTRELGQEAERARASEYEQGGLSIRWQVWMTGIRLTLENPLLGVGANAFQIAEGGQTFGRGNWKAAHNSFLQIAAELGIPALIVYLYLLYRGIRNCRSVIRFATGVSHLRYHLWTAHGFEAALYGYIVAGAALNHAYSSILYFMLAISVVLKWITARDSAHFQEVEPGGRNPGNGLPWWKGPR